MTGRTSYAQHKAFLEMVARGGEAELAGFLEAAIWHKTTTKNGTRQVLPLSPEAVALFKELPNRGPYCFEGATPQQAWSRTAVHSESGLLTLRQLVLQAVRHLRHHLPFIAEKRAALEVGQPETYTPGATKNASDFMARRTIESHGQFFLSHLTPGVSVLDCGCGPGTISLSIAERIVPGRLVGIDREPSQIEKAQAAARQTGRSNTEFQSAGIYTLPFADNSFDRVFSHALIEHLSDPILAAKQMFRVLKPGGVIGVCSPDWGGFVLAPPSTELTNAIAAYTHLQTRNGGDVNAGRQLGAHLQAAGFETIQMSARYECYDSLAVIGEYLALQLERAGDSVSAEALRTWSRHDDGMFAQCWVSCVARKPLADSTRRGDDRP